MDGTPWASGVAKPVIDEVEPGDEVAFRLRHGRVPRGSRGRASTGRRAAQHVLEVDERVAAAREQRGDVGSARDESSTCTGDAALGEGALDGVELVGTTGRRSRGRQPC